MSLELRRTMAIFGLLAGGAFAAAPDAEIDLSTGLVKAGGWEEVRAYCGSCHSLDLVTSQHDSATGWQETIRTMQRSHNMVDLPAPTEARIVDYLARHYVPQERSHRRAPVPARLMPRPRIMPVAEGEETGLRPTTETWRREDCGPTLTDSSEPHSG